ncbi:hypothetical protein JD844_023131 [Phrynosoma platyrhinos]|uniref:Uncharacterized protein n=1 Tax=Phrynosoma platyrhinos TaxID=52577 RepID=A0ABQ7SWK8_PHRPL|nr:hypothetical protein JD844_023131 [Phrynosoma platyrhinos]
MQRRSERLAILQQLRPISYRETGVKRVFKKIRRKRQSAAAQTKGRHTTWKEKKTEKDWGMERSGPDDSEQPCCSKYLVDQSHLLRQYLLENPPLTEPTMDVTTQQDPQLLVVEEYQRTFKMKLVFLTLIFILVISFRFMSGFSSHRVTLKETMKVKLR